MHDRQLTYWQLLEQAIRAGNGLMDLGVGPNTPVAIAMANCLEFAIADQGVIQAGATKVPLNDMLSDDEVLYILAHAGVRVAIVDARRVPLLEARGSQLPELDTVIVVGDSAHCPATMVPWRSFLADARPEYTEVDVRPEHLAFIGYTGGTTGKPKGATHYIEPGFDPATVIRRIMNVYTSEVENALQPCAGVAQVAVVGLPDPDWGEAVTAFVVPQPGASPDTAELLAHCKANLSKYKAPKAIHLVDSLPVTAYGKLDKKALRQQWSDQT